MSKKEGGPIIMPIPDVFFTKNDWQIFGESKNGVSVGISIDCVMDKSDNSRLVKILFMKLLNFGDSPLTIEWISYKEKPNIENLSIDFWVDEDIEINSFPSMEYLRGKEARCFNTAFANAEFNISENDNNLLVFALYIKIAGYNEPLKAPINIDIIERPR